MTVKMNILLLFSRVLIGAVFIVSGWEKLLAPVENFQASLEAYEVFPAMFIPLISHTVPWMEFVMGILIVMGFLTRAVSFVIGGFLMVFILVLARTVILDLPIASCGCFGDFVSLSPLQSLVLDSGLLILTALVFKCSAGRFSVDAIIKDVTRHVEGEKAL